MLRSLAVLVAVGFTLSGCASGTSSLASGLDEDGGDLDGATGTRDATVESGALGPGSEAGRADTGSSATEDASSADAASDDAASEDSGADAASEDAGSEDSSIPDSGAADTSAPIDSGVADSSVADSAPPVDAADASCGAPTGNYTATCSGCSLVGNTLTCECQNAQQIDVSASIDLCSCPQLSLQNENGAFNCCGIPGGSYTGSCSGCSTTGNVLSCSCKNDAQEAGAATLDLCTCASTTAINNQNGVLSCH